MTFIKHVDFSKFLHNQVFTLHSLILAQVETLSNEHLPAVVTPYRSTFTRFDAALKTGGKSAYTKTIADLDAKQDKLYTGLVNHVRNMKNHFDEQKAQIAYEVDLIIHKYENPTRLAYLQEDAILKNLIKDLRAYDNPTPSEPEEDEPVVQSVGNEVHDRLALIGVDEWVNQLETINTAFMDAYVARNAEDASVATGESLEARKATDIEYYKVERRINSLADIFGDADYLTVINNINQLIAKEEATLAAHRTKIANAKEKEETDGDTPTPDTPTPDAPPADDEPVITND